MIKPISLGSDGSAYIREQDGGLTLYLDRRNPQETDEPDWRVSHALSFEEVTDLRRILEAP